MPDDFSFSLSPEQIITADPCPEVAKLELTFPYYCGGLVAAEFDVRVEVGTEDGELLLGAIELYGFDSQHHGSFKTSKNLTLNKKIRNYIYGSDKETTRAREVLAQHCEISPEGQARSGHKSDSLLTPRISAYQECHRR